MKPIIKYLGGKSKEIKSFISNIPKFDTYIEPFFGGGALFWELNPEKAILNDLNTRLIKFYESVRDSYNVIDKEISTIRDSYDRDKSIELFRELRDMFNNKIPYKYNYGTVFLALNKLGFQGINQYNKKGEYSTPYGRYDKINLNCLFREHSERLKNPNIKLYNKDYKEILSMAGPDDFVFLDPPYDTNYREYGNQDSDFFGDDKHIELAEEFKKCKGSCLLIINSSNLIDNLYKDYIKDSYIKKYNFNIKLAGKRTEEHLIIRNY